MTQQDLTAGQPSLSQVAPIEDLSDNTKYPYCVPSYNPAVLNGSFIEAWLENASHFGETECDVYELTEGRATWQLNKDDAQMRTYLQVLIAMSISSVNCLLRNADLRTRAKTECFPGSVSLF